MWRVRRERVRRQRRDGRRHGPFVQRVREAADVRQHRARAPAALAVQRPGRAGVRRPAYRCWKVEGWQGPAERVGAGERALGRRGHGVLLLLLLLCLLEQDFEVLGRVGELNVLVGVLGRAPLVAVDVAAVLALDGHALREQNRALLLPLCSGIESFGIGCDELLVVFVEFGLADLKAFPSLHDGGDFRLDVGKLAIGFGFSVVEIVGDA